MKNKPTFALLFAGLFLSLSVQANNCIALTGQEVSFLSFQTDCPINTTIEVAGDKCILERKSRAGQSEFICAFASGTWTGGPWQYTGGRQIESPPLVPPIKPVSPIQWDDPNLNNNGEVVNSNLVKLSQSFKALSESLNKTISDSASNQQNLANRVDKINVDIQAALSFNTNQTGRQIQTLQSSLNSAQSSIENNDDDNFQTLYDQAERHNNVAVLGVADIKQQANQIESLKWQIDGVMGTVTTSNNYLQETLPQMALSNSDSLGQIIGGIGVLEQRLDSLSSGTGVSTDLTPTNNLIRENIANIQGVQSSINTVGMYTSRTADGLQSVSYALGDLNSNNLEQLWEAQGLRTDLNSQLSGIKTAIENSSGGGSGDNSGTNQKLDVVSQKLDGIGEGVNNISDSLKAGTGQKDGPTLCSGDDCYRGKSWITPKYPDGLKSIYQNHKAAFQDSSVHGYLKGFNPSIAGSAPTSWQFCIDVGFANLGCHSLELPPYILSFVRLVILITAGFLCRRLIFGG